MRTTETLTFNPETENGLDYLANHDIKAAAYLIFAGEETVSSTGLANAVKSRLGVNLRCIGSYPETYKKGGFAVTEAGPTHCGRVTKLYSTVNQENGLAVVGAMLDWSERHNSSLILALSSTSSRGSRSPVNTIQILDGLLRGVNIGEISPSRYKKTKEGWNTNYNTRFKQLVETGIVISKDQETYFKILDPNYKGVPPLSSLSQVQQNIYTILKVAKKIDGNPDRKWGLGEIENLAKEIGIINVQDPKSYQEFHKRLIRVISKAHQNILQVLQIKYI